MRRLSALSVNKLKKTIIPPIYKEYSSLFCSERVNFSPSDLNKIIYPSFEKAIDNFDKLKLRYRYNLSAYVSYWIREELITILCTKTLRKINADGSNAKQNQDRKALIDFFSILPLGSSFAIEQQIFKPLSLARRKKIFSQYQPMFEELKKPFKGMVCERNLNFQKKGFPNFIAFNKQQYRIPEDEYKFFIDNTDKIISFCYKQLPDLKNLPSWFFSRYNQQCYLCLIPFPQRITNEEILEEVAELYPQLRPFFGRIQIIYSDKASTRYLKEKDRYEVSLRKEINQRHRMLDFVHELGHVIYFIDSFFNNVDILKGGKYLAEKEALTVFFRVINKISPTVLRAYYAELLQVIHRSLFELSIYSKQDQDYDRLYAQLFRKCFPCSHQRSNPLYLLDERITVQPLTSLAYTIASVNLLLAT